MIFRNLILSVVILTSSAQPAALYSSTFDGISGLRPKLTSAHRVRIDTSGFDSAYKLSLPKPVQDKNFFLLSLFQRNSDVRKLLSRNQTLKQLANNKLAALKKSETCDNVGCFDQLIRFEPAT